MAGYKTASMDKKHTLVGEDFFRTMMRLEDERRRCFVRGNLWGSRGDGSGSQTSNVVSLDRYRREQQQRAQRPTAKPTKPAA